VIVSVAIDASLPLNLIGKLTGIGTHPRIEIDSFVAQFRESMPLYEYQCKKCSHRFERIQKFSDPPVKKCPKCGSAVEQTISAPAVQFKGSGWYVTDYAKKSSTPAASGDSSSKSEGKKDEKPKPEHKKAEKK
jgi:putative FmdB family regulatory protein